ncbi:MAG: methyltransferase domain-containing protein [Planctomycetes bacterium]|nr:methyltransferase domain-containing protein [Planctomycetota bacterium]
MGTEADKQTKTTGGLTQTKCPLCDHPEMTGFFEIESAPVFCNVLWNTREEALSAHRAPIHLAYCNNCGLIYNVAFDPELIEYSPDYENSLHFSPRFQKHAEDTANRLIQQYQLRNKDIIEIGCGQGDFLAMLQRLGDNRVLGFDPSYTHEKTAAYPEDSTIEVITQTYSTMHTSQPVDFICCRHVLEHIDSPVDFLRSIRCTIGQRSDCVVYFEVPNALYTLKDMGVWDIIYEHCSYFTSESLANVFMRVGFASIHVTEQYDGQFLSIEVRPTAAETNSGADVELAFSNIQDLVNRFHKAYRDKVDSWQHTLLQLAQQKKRVVLWGGGSKGVTFLNVLDISYEQIEYIVDVNPRKQGKFIAGTGQQVIAPDFLKEYQPQTVIIMNPIYRKEIQDTIKEFALAPEFEMA